MKYILLLLFTVNASALDLTIPGLDMTLPEQPAVNYEDLRFVEFQNLEFHNISSKSDKIIFWTLNALDVITTYEGLKSSPHVYEVNPLYPARPSLGQLVVGKAIIGSYIINNLDSRQIKILNTSLTIAIANNYEIYN